MLSPRLTNCPECANIPSLLKKIDCKLAELGNNLYNNISYMLNKPVPSSDILQLIGYRRILMYKYCNPSYVEKYSVQMIASRVIRLTAGCVSKCNELERCLEEPCDIKIVPNPTTTSTSTLPIPTTTTTSSTSSTTSTSTTAVPTTTTTSSSSTSTTTSTSSSTSTTTSTSSTSSTTTTTTTVIIVCETLGRAASFAILGGSNVTNTGESIITGDLGLYPGMSATGFPPGIVNGVEHITDTQAQDAQTDANAAFTCLNAIPTVMPLSGTLNGGSLGPNVYEASSSLSVIDVTFNAGGNPDAVFIVKIGSTLTFENDSEVLLTNGAQACNIYWVVGSSATLGTNATVLGNIIANISVTINTNATLTGRAFALSGNITMDNNTIANCNCTSNPCGGITTTTTSSSSTTTTTTTVAPVAFGLLYNWYAARDSRNIAAIGWEVPTIFDYQTLADYLGAAGNYSTNTVGGRLKEIGLTYWLTPNTGAINDVGFNGKGSGVRNVTFTTKEANCNFWTTSEPFSNTGGASHLYNSNAQFACVSNVGYAPTLGYSIRLKKITTTLTNGQTGTYVGNDGRVYRTICIGTQEWLADDLCETRFRNLDIIPYNGLDNPNNFTDAEWAALSTAGTCAYNNDVNNVAPGFNFPI